MDTAAALENSFSGQGRCRKKKSAKTDLASHYQFALWSYEDGKRIAVPVGGVRSDKRAEYPLISTAIMNEGTRTETLIWLHFDLDYKRADKKGCVAFADAERGAAWIRERSCSHGIKDFRRGFTLCSDGSA